MHFDQVTANEVNSNIFCCAADMGAVKGECAAGLGADGFQNLAAFGQDFRAYAIAGKEADFLVHGKCPQGGPGPPGSYFAWASRRDLT